MTTEKKITVKYFLNKKIKPRVYGDTRHYPVYMKVIFDRKSTEIKMISVVEKPLWIDEAGFKTYIIDKKEGLRMPPIPHKEIILIKAIRREYDKVGDSFEFKPFVSKFRIYEKYFYPILGEVIIHQLKYILEGKIGYADFGFIFSSSHITNVFANYLELYVSGKIKAQLSDHIKMLLTCYVLMYKYTEEFRYPPGKNSLSSLPLGHTYGSIYGWRFEDHSIDFKEFVKKVISNHSFIDFFSTNGVDRTLSYFEVEPKKEDLHLYVALFDEMTDKLLA